MTEFSRCGGPSWEGKQGKSHNGSTCSASRAKNSHWSALRSRRIGSPPQRLAQVFQPAADGVVGRRVGSAALQVLAVDGLLDAADELALGRHQPQDVLQLGAEVDGVVLAT